MISNQSSSIYANESVTDASTAQGYTQTFNTDSTQYSGRIWTDKSVSTSAQYGKKPFNLDENKDEDFLVTFSALSSTTTLRSETASPVDVVFVLDFSASMTWGVNSTTVSNPNDSRIKALVDSLNNAIDTLVNANDNNRIGIVTFNRIGSEFMELTSAADIKNKNIQNKQYLELTHFSGTSGQDNGQSTVTNYINEQTRNTDSKINIQFGLNEAMQMLNDVQDTTVIIDGKEVQRIPNVVLMSDGAPTTISMDAKNTNRWWEELSKRNNDSIGWGDNKAAWSANGMLPMMTASYMKEVITDKYFKNNTDNQSMNIYTIGFSTNYQTDQMVELANLVLDPVNNFDNAQNSGVNEIRLIYDAWNRYSSNSPITIHYVEESYEEDEQPDVQNYTLVHPNTGFDIDTLKYNTAYYAAEDSDSLNDAFNSITNSMIDQGKAPTEVTGSVTNSGYITFVDTLGDYMEVKNVKGLVIGNNVYTGSYNKENGTITFTGSYTNNVYGSQNLRNLVINVTEQKNKQVLTMKIPASLIPLVLDTVDLDASGNVTNQTESSMYPMRLVYSVGLQSDILNTDGTVDLSKVDTNYINSHKDENGNVLFYSNYYDGNNQSLDNQTAGNAYVEYEPSVENEYYFLQEDTPIYLDEGQTPVTSFDPQATYYVPFTYYENGSKQTTYEQRSASVMQGYTKEINGEIYLQAGAPRLGNIDSFTQVKQDNVTNTAQTAYAPRFIYSGEEQDPQNGMFHVYLGNNGQIKVSAASLTITKQVEAEEGINPSDADFTFEIDLTNNNQSISANYVVLDANDQPVLDADGNQITGTINEQNNRVTIKKDQKIQLNGLSVGTQYTVTEVDVSDPYTFKSIESSVQNTTIKDQSASGELIGDNKNAILTYTNTYNASVKSNISITKNISGRTFKQQDQFTFDLTADEKNQDGAVINQTSITMNPESGDSFSTTIEDALTFTKTGLYTFYLKENSNNPLENMTYDSTEYKLIYTVTLNDAKDGFVVSEPQVQIKQSDGSYTNVNDIVFNNTYQEPIDFTIDVTKNLTGRGWQTDDTFTFTLAAGDEATQNAIDASEVILPTETSLTITDETANYTDSFDSITFTKAGTYSFKVSESKQNPITGITYDEDKTIQVVVTENNGVLTFADSVDTSSVTFNNSYDPVPYTLEGSTYLTIQKEFSGKDWTDETFTFTLSADEDYGEKVTMPQETTLTLTSDNSEQHFGNIIFNEVGVYSFTIKENVPSEQGNISYDTHEYKVQVTVTDNQSGSLVATQGSIITNGSNRFINTYTPTSQTATIQINKAISGRDMNNSDTGAYEFTLETVDNAPLPQQVRATNDENGKVTFMPISYTGTQDATYEYVIKETGNKNTSVTSSTEEIHVKVMFDYDPATGQITPSVTYTGDDGENDNTITNVYSAKPVTIDADITGAKTVTSSVGNAYTMVGNEFSFKIVPSQSNPASDPIQEQTVTNDANGNIVFAQDPTYTEAGTYTYTVYETNSSVAGITIDSSQYTITVTITDLGDGQLTQSVSIAKDSQTVNTITFNNTYDPTSTSIRISGTKNLTGKDLEDGEFGFLLQEISRTYTVTEETQTVEESTENVSETITEQIPDASTYQETIRNTGNAFTFSTITYDRPGTYVYQVSEVNEGKQGITYDSNVYTVTVTVTDEDGQLKTSVTGAENIVFNNSYNPEPTILTGNTAIKATKNLNGKDLVGEDFIFELKDEDGNVLAEAKNALDGSITFEGIEFSKAGTYYYTISERNTSGTGITYDGSIYVVQIDVEDKGGYLEVTNMQYFKDNAKVDAVVFNNTYKPVGTKVQFYPTKVLEGRELKEGEFTFVLKDQDGNVISETTNNAEGIIAFDPIEFEKADTYVYTVSEVAGNDETITYDDTTYTYTVVVEDVNGQLVTKTSCDGDQVFHNKYEQPTEPTPEDPGKTNRNNTSTPTYAGLFTSLAVDAVALAGIATLLRRKNIKK